MMMSFKEEGAWVAKSTGSIPLIISMSDTRKGKAVRVFLSSL